MKRLAIAAPAILFVLVAGGMAIAFSSQLGIWAYVLGIAAAAGAWSMVAYVTRDEPPTEAAQLEMIRAAVQEQQVQLEKRELDLMNRLAVYHEWMEFPEPVDLSSEPTDAELSDLAEKDRELQALLSETSEKLFNDILQNRYAPDGKVSLPLIREDVLELTEKIARVYKPDADQLLLKANIEDILRSSSRACLQMLTVLDLLPVDVRQQNVDDLYLYIRRAVQAFGVYKKAQPYWGYVNSAYYLGRLALGANPLSMGAWWVMGRVGHQAGQHLTKRYLNRQAVTLVQQALRVLGNEVACVYGAGFRYRDVNWIYAAELTELMSVLPVSHRCLSHALRETGSLALRSEYDRVFLYRCIAEGLSAKPEQYRAAVVLTPAERKSAALRLEKFANLYGGGASPRKLQRWSAGAEARLQVQLNFSLSLDTEEPKAEPTAVARSLMSFLVEIKELEPDEAWRTVCGLEALQLDEQQLENCRIEWDANPAFFFELPDLPPGGAEAKEYLQQLIDLALVSGPRDERLAQVIENAGAYLRIEDRELEQLIASRGAEAVAGRVRCASPKLHYEQVAPLLDWLEQQSDSQILIAAVQTKWPQKSKTRDKAWNRLILVGDGQRLSALKIQRGASEVVWCARRDDVRLEKGGYLSGGFAVKGGEWLGEWSDDDAPPPEQMTIRSGRFTLPAASDDYKILDDWIEKSDAE